MPKKKETKGRSSTYSEDITDVICERIAIGESLRLICQSEEMPALSTVFKWLNQHKEFSDQYARAREEQAECLVDEINEIADDGRNDWMEKYSKNDKQIGWILNGEAVARSRLRIDARKWQASKLKPKKYGEKLELAGDPKNPVSVPIFQLLMNDPNNSEKTSR